MSFAAEIGDCLRYPLRLLVFAALVLPGGHCAAWAVPTPEGLFFRTGDAFTLQRLGVSEAEDKDALPGFRRYPFGGSSLPESSILAFEDNAEFTMVVGDLTRRRESEPRLKDDSPRVLRRLLLLKPSTLVIDDEIRKTASSKRLAWSLQTTGTPKVNGRQIRIVEGERELVLQTLLPRNFRLSKTARKSGVPQAGYLLDVAPEGEPDEVRFINVLHVRLDDDKRPIVPAEINERQGPVRLILRTLERTFQLTLPRWREAAGEITILGADGKPIVERCPLASGVLPHTAEGMAMIERWDGAYRSGRLPAWDTGRPSSDLVQAVEKGTLRPGRAVELGCGSGTNAVYLAAHDFDVTAIDLSSTALMLAQKKAQHEGVAVRWLLADVLALPRLQPFDVVYDRGCYHGVRKQHAAAYVESLRRLSKPGTLVLILAGSAKEPSSGSGPPRVTEQEIRSDFSALFEVVELRETRFDAADPKAKGALAWSVLLKRKE